MPVVLEDDPVDAVIVIFPAARRARRRADVGEALSLPPAGTRGRR